MEEKVFRIVGKHVRKRKAAEMLEDRGQGREGFLKTWLVVLTVKDEVAL